MPSAVVCSCVIVSSIPSCNQLVAIQDRFIDLLPDPFLDLVKTERNSGFMTRWFKDSLQILHQPSRLDEVIEGTARHSHYLGNSAAFTGFFAPKSTDFSVGHMFVFCL